MNKAHQIVQQSKIVSNTLPAKSDNQLTWTDKYTPTRLSDIVCNRKSVVQLMHWLKNYNKNRRMMLKNKESKRKRTKRNTTDGSANSCIIVTGNHGVGKTSTIRTVLNCMGWNIQKLNFTGIKGKHVDKAIKKMMQSTDIVDLINSSKRQKTAIVVDEIESITSTTEKNCIVTLQKLNDIEWFCPVIFIANNQHNKLISETKKNSLNVKFYDPYDSDMRQILLRITKNEKINIRSEVVIDKIITHSQSDIRRLINTLQDINYAYGNQKITEQLVDEYCKMSKTKDTDIDLYRATNGLMYEYDSIDDCLRYYETEKVLLPLMVHQNYLKNVITNVRRKDKSFELIKNVANSLSRGDVVENYIYGNQNWEMQEIHGFHTCVATSFYICDTIKHPQRVRLDFTTDLNKTSIKNINKKNIGKTNKCFKSMNIADYIYINKIIKKLIEEGNIEKCVDLLKNYDIKLEHIESLLKIDKIKNSKTTLTSKQKKEFLKYLNS